LGLLGQGANCPALTPRESGLFPENESSAIGNNVEGKLVLTIGREVRLAWTGLGTPNNRARTNIKDKNNENKFCIGLVAALLNEDMID
jgi:hypothetical protein